ncbi:unnamed protein product [Rhizophagus irregularis]|nr:unnamed protein product [Rhizophagus irregularis]
MHSKAIYTTSLQIDISKLNINDLLKPKNPDVRYDNMISMESSAESLQIDNLQLRIGAEPDNSDYSYEKNDDMIS